MDNRLSDMTDKALPRQTLDIWDGTAITPETADGFRPALDVYALDTKQTAGGVLICPGGGYSHRADHEGRDVAVFMNAAGLHAFVLHYRVAPNRYPSALNDACRAMRILRARADDWRLRRDRIAVCGFSAGGHLAACLSVLHARAATPCEPVLHAQPVRPDATILGYAVLSSSPGLKHEGTYTNLLGPHTAAEADRVSPERYVETHTPPAFLWHTLQDRSVDVRNSLLYARALHEHGIPFELHVFPCGEHGLGLSPDVPGASAWPGLCRTWLYHNGFLSPERSES